MKSVASKTAAVSMQAAGMSNENYQQLSNSSSHHNDIKSNMIQQRNLGNANNAPKSNGNSTSSNAGAESSPTSPICRCRVMYLGSAVPHITKDGLQGIQEPLRELYPDAMSLSSGNVGIDSWLSVWSNGVLIENIDENGREVKKFFQIEALHYCAAVKFVAVQNNKPYATIAHNAQHLQQQQASESFQFAPLDSPIARQSDLNHPPVFACILRRTTGIKVLECHAFICKREPAANALVRCCFHAYADTVYASQHGSDINNNNGIQSAKSSLQGDQQQVQKVPEALVARASNMPPAMPTRKSKSMAALNEPENQANELQRRLVQQQQKAQKNDLLSNGDYYGVPIRDYDASTSKSQASQKSSKQSKVANQQLLLNNQKFSKSMHHLHDLNSMPKFNDQSIHYANHLIHDLNSRTPFPNYHNQQPPLFPTQPEPHLLSQVPPQMLNQSFYNPFGGKSHGTSSHGGTLKSIKSLAANSIATTLLKSKKHAKTMSLAQMNPMLQQQGFSHTLKSMGNPMSVPMFPPSFPFISGSQTMKAPSKSMIQAMNVAQNSETMNPKDLKKMLKKNAKYGILDPANYPENGLPLFMPPNIPQQMPNQIPPPGPFGMMLPTSKSGTMMSQHHPQADPFGMDVPDFMKHQMPRHPLGMDLPLPPPPQTILVKPNPEFLKSKAGKKWIKQQKEFKKLLPPHLEGLPIVFGPPPPEALQTSVMPSNPTSQNLINPNQLPVPPLGMLSMYSNPNTFNGRMSTTSTIFRGSPSSQHVEESYRRANGLSALDYGHQARMRSIESGGELYDHRRYNSDESSMIMPNSEYSGEIYHKPVQRSRSQSKSSHMVEQKTICLGDENDYDDDEPNNHRGAESYQNGRSNQREITGSKSNLNKQHEINSDGNNMQSLNDARHYERLNNDHFQNGNSSEQNNSYNNFRGDKKQQLQQQQQQQQFYNTPYDQRGVFSNNSSGQLSDKVKMNGFSKQYTNTNGHLKEISNLSTRLENQLNMNHH